MLCLVEEITEKTAVLPANLQQEVLDFVEFISRKQFAPLTETALLSEQVLAEDWNRSEEEDAWKPFQKYRNVARMKHSGIRVNQATKPRIALRFIQATWLLRCKKAKDENEFLSGQEQQAFINSLSQNSLGT